MIHLRPAEPRDAPEIAAIWNPIIDCSAATFTTQRKTEAGLIADIGHRGAGFQVACHGGHVLGFATFFQFRGGPGYACTMEHSIQLAPQARGRGIGRALMASLETQARAQGVHSLWAGVSAQNPGSVRFHQRLGFVEIAVLPQVGYKFGRWMDLVLLQKIL